MAIGGINEEITEFAISRARHRRDWGSHQVCGRTNGARKLWFAV